MKNQVLLVIFLFFGFAFLVYLFPVIFVEAAKLESGVTINGTSIPETENCYDTIDNDNDGKIDTRDEDCAAALAGPTAACEVQIVSGVPINYGQLTAGQISAEKQVIIKSVESGVITGEVVRIYIKGGNWVSDEAPNPTISGPEVTHVTNIPNNLFNYYERKSLSSNEFQRFSISAGVNTPVFFEVKVPVNASSGSFHQEVTIGCSR